MYPLVLCTSVEYYVVCVVRPNSVKADCVCELTSEGLLRNCSKETIDKCQHAFTLYCGCMVLPPSTF